MRDLFLINLEPGASLVSAENNDLEFAQGDLVTVDKHARKFQDVVKILETERGENPVLPEYGTDLPSLPGSVTPASKASDSIVRAIAFLAEIEPSKDPAERIDGIRSMKVTPTPDGSEIDIRLSVALKDGNDIEYQRRQ